MTTDVYPTNSFILFILKGKTLGKEYPDMTLVGQDHVIIKEQKLC